MSNVIEITTEEQFKDQIEVLGTVVAKFSTSTCGPCKMMGPVFEKWAQDDFGYSPTFLSVVADTTQELSLLAKNLGIQSVPAFLVYKDSALVNTVVGAFPLATLKSKLDL